MRIGLRAARRNLPEHACWLEEREAQLQFAPPHDAHAWRQRSTRETKQKYQQPERKKERRRRKKKTGKKQAETSLAEKKQTGPFRFEQNKRNDHASAAYRGALFGRTVAAAFVLFKKD